MPQSQCLEGHDLQSHLPGGCRSLFVAPEAMACPEEILGLGENTKVVMTTREHQDGDDYLSAKGLADQPLVDHVAIYSCHGRELELVWLGDSLSLSSGRPPQPLFAGCICDPQKGDGCLWLTPAECHC